MAIVEQSAVEVAPLLEREVTLEAAARERDKLVAELEQLRALINRRKQE